MEDAIKHQRMERFKQMGIPMPMQKEAAPTNLQMAASGASADKVRKLQEILSGGKKEEISKVIEARDRNFNPIQVPMPKNKKTQQKPSDSGGLTNTTARNPQAEMFEKALYGETTSNSQSVDSYGSNIPETNIALKMQQKAIDVSRQQQTQSTTTMQHNMPQNYNMPYVPPDVHAGVSNNSTPITSPVYNIPESYKTIGISLTEEEFEKKVKSIAIDVSKKIVKKVILEYAKSGKGIIIESNKIKKAEIVDSNKVKINGKLYKLTPIKTTVS